MDVAWNERMRQSLRGVFSNDFSELIVDGLNMMESMEKSLQRIELCIVALTILTYVVTVAAVLILALVGISSLCKRYRTSRRQRSSRNDPWAHVLKSDKV